MKATLFAYCASLRKGPDGRLTATFRDVPEALTDGADQAEALANAADALTEALLARVADGEDIPLPSLPKKGEWQIVPDPTIAAKAALHQAARDENVNAAELARRLGTDHKEARRMLDPRHKTKLPRIAEALGSVGRQVVIGVCDRPETNDKALRKSGPGSYIRRKRRVTQRKRA